MTVTFDAGAKQTVGGTSTVNAVCAFTGAAGAVLLAAVGVGTNVSVSACNVNGVAMTQLGRVLNDGAGVNGTLFGLTSPPAGVLSISATLVGGALGTMIIIGATYLGARGVNPFGTIVNMTAGAVVVADISISSSAGDMVVCFASGAGPIFSFSANNATTRFTDGQHAAYRWVDAAGASPAVSLSASCNNTSQNLAWMGFNIAASRSASSVFMNLLGVGF